MRSLPFFLITIDLLIVSCVRWPSLDELSLRVQTRLNSDEFHVDFYVADASKDEIENSMVVAKLQLPDGKHVTEIYDKYNDVRITRIVLLGEIVDGQTPFERYCFITKLGVDILPPEAVQRLRQKNSLAVRLAEEDRGVESTTFPYLVPLGHVPAGWSSVSRLCAGIDGVYLSDDVYSDLNETLPFVQHGLSELPPCGAPNMDDRPCECSIKYCMQWYPCGWKYCDENNLQLLPNSTSTAAYRCGIQSCRIRRVLNFRSPDFKSSKPSCDSALINAC